MSIIEFATWITTFAFGNTLKQQVTPYFYSVTQTQEESCCCWTKHAVTKAHSNERRGGVEFAKFRRPVWIHLWWSVSSSFELLPGLN